MYKELTPSQKEELRKILRAPIIVDGSIKGFRWDSNKKIILSNQTYISENSKDISVDADMSNIAVAFYKLLYGIDMLSEDGRLIDENFAGDTMNTLAPFYDSKKDVYRKQMLDVYIKKDKENIMNKVTEFKEKYHCLANFWILPYGVGRKIEDFGKGRDSTYCDFMDNFLIGIMRKTNKQSDKTNRYNQENTFTEKYPEYCNKFKKNDLEKTPFDWDTFASRHFINDIYLLKHNGFFYVTSYSKLTDPIQTINSMDTLIKMRADAIVRSKLAYRLYNKLSEQLNQKPE